MKSASIDKSRGFRLTISLDDEEYCRSQIEYGERCREDLKADGSMIKVIAEYLLMADFDSALTIIRTLKKQHNKAKRKTNPHTKP